MPESRHSGLALLITGIGVCLLSWHFSATLGIVIGGGLIVAAIATYIAGADSAPDPDDGTYYDRDDEGWLGVLSRLLSRRNAGSEDGGDDGRG